MNWIELSKRKNKSTESEEITEKIISVLSNSITEFFELNLRSARTRLIKKELSKLGHQLCYKVYANRLLPKDVEEIENIPKNPKCKEIGKGFKNREWLYDLHWYTELEEPYTPISLPLVMECEWENKRQGDEKKINYGAVKFDFQKLLISNATLRLMIFKVKKEDLNFLGTYFENAINSYIHLEKKAKFLFIAYDNRIKECFYSELTKRIKNN